MIIRLVLRWMYMLLKFTRNLILPVRGFNPLSVQSILKSQHTNLRRPRLRTESYSGLARELGDSHQPEPDKFYEWDFPHENSR